MSTETSSKPGLFPLMVRFLAEILVIFIGITMSFLFDQWRKGQEIQDKQREIVAALLTDLQIKKEEFQHDTPSCKFWIDRLDSIQRSRLTGTTPDVQVKWFWEIIARGDIFFFTPETEGYRNAQNTDVFQAFPDSIRRSLHSVFFEYFGYNQIIYAETKNTITQFRNQVIIPSGRLGRLEGQLNQPEEMELLRQEMKKPAYGNFINEVILQEEKLAKLNGNSERAIEKLIDKLNTYLKALE